MLQVCRSADLGQEQCRADHPSELAAQHLERDAAAVPQVLGQVHRRHTALAELALEAVRLRSLRLPHTVP
jgi:hypothetical protein